MKTKEGYPIYFEPECDANVGHMRYEAYCDGTYLGAADSLDDAVGYVGTCVAGDFSICDTQNAIS